MEKELNKINNTDVIVVQALTRDLSNHEVSDMNNRINQVVDQALTKANKVVVNTIVNREDKRDIGAKAELVNAYVKYHYINNENVIVCDNDNLRDRKFRLPDGIHLTQHGTSIFANNMKYKIAEALKINVIKKEFTRRGPRYNSRHDFFGGNYG